MSRKTVIAAALFACSILGVFVWLWLTDALPLYERKESRGAENGGENAMLTEEAQTPIQPPKEAPPLSESEPLTSLPETDTGPYRFERWQDAANHLAELIGVEYDALLAAGMEPLEAQSQAYHRVFERIFDNKEDPALAAALYPYLPLHPDSPIKLNADRRIPLKEFSSAAFLVRAGRLPSTAMKKGRISLPNGEYYYHDDHEDVIVIFKMRHIRAETEEGRQKLAELEKANADWKAKLVQNPADMRAREVLEYIEEEIENLKTPQLKTYRYERSGGEPGHPDYKRTELDLGVID